MTAALELIDLSVQPTTTTATTTVGLLREMLSGLASEIEVHVGVYDSNRFNVLIGTLPVTAPRLMPLPSGAQVLLRVPGIS